MKGELRLKRKKQWNSRLNSALHEFIRSLTNVLCVIPVFCISLYVELDVCSKQQEKDSARARWFNSGPQTLPFLHSPRSKHRRKLLRMINRRPSNCTLSVTAARRSTNIFSRFVDTRETLCTGIHRTICHSISPFHEQFDTMLHAVTNLYFFSCLNSIAKSHGAHDTQRIWCWQAKKNERDGW